MKQMHRNNVIFFIIGTFSDKGHKYELYLCNDCHDLMRKAMNFKDVATVSVKGNCYRIYFWYMSKYDTINILKNSNLNEKCESYNFFSII